MIANPLDAMWVHQPAPSEPYPSHSWVEVSHCAKPVGDSGWKAGPMWLYAAPGTGVSVNLGRTVAVDSWGEAAILLHSHFPHWLPRNYRCERRGEWLAPPAAFARFGDPNRTIDSVQILRRQVPPAPPLCVSSMCVRRPTAAMSEGSVPTPYISAQAYLPRGGIYVAALDPVSRPYICHVAAGVLLSRAAPRDSAPQRRRVRAAPAGCGDVRETPAPARVHRRRPRAARDGDVPAVQQEGILATCTAQRALALAIHAQLEVQPQPMPPARLAVLLLTFARYR